MVEMAERPAATPARSPSPRRSPPAERRRVRHLRQLGVDERLQHVAQRRAQRLDVAAEQEQRQRREEPARIAAAMTRRPAGYHSTLPSAVSPVERGEIGAGRATGSPARPRNHERAQRAAGQQTNAVPARPATAAASGPRPSPARNSASGVNRKRTMRISSGPVVAEANTTAETSPAPNPMSRRYRHQSSCPAVSRLETRTVRPSSSQPVGHTWPALTWRPRRLTRLTSARTAAGRGSASA